LGNFIYTGLLGVMMFQ